MKIANIYSHLNGYEHMIVHHKDLWDEIVEAINSIDANAFTKKSKIEPQKFYFSFSKNLSILISKTTDIL